MAGGVRAAALEAHVSRAERFVQSALEGEELRGHEAAQVPPRLGAPGLCIDGAADVRVSRTLVQGEQGSHEWTTGASAQASGPGIFARSVVLGPVVGRVPLRAGIHTRPDRRTPGPAGRGLGSRWA